LALRRRLDCIVSALGLEAVSKRFGAFTALDHIDLDIGSGELVALLGPSGCGKTTLLRLIAGLDAPGSGTIRFDGSDMADVAVRKRGVGMVSQHYALFPHMSVADNIAFGLEARKLAGKEIDKRVREILQIVQLDSFRDRFPAQLSGGQMQRVAIARTLVTEPRILLMDEPFASLDTALRIDMRRFVRTLQQRYRITTVFVTHDQDEAMEIADRVAILLEGKLRQFDTPDAVYHRPADTEVARFLKATNIFAGTVSLEGRLVMPWGELELSRDIVVEPGKRVTAMIRDEALALLSSDHLDQANLLPVVVSRVDFHGATVSYVVEVGDMQFTVEEHSTRRLEPGAALYLSVPARHLWLFPSERGGASAFRPVKENIE